VTFNRFLALGAASGALAAAATFIPLGDVAAPVVFGHCLGLSVAGSCNGTEASIYLFPGLIFGIFFGGMLFRQGRIGAGQTVVFVLSSAIANAIAVFVCLAFVDPLGDKIAILDLGIAISGVIAGAVGGGVLVTATRLLIPGATIGLPIAIASALGIVVTAVTELDRAGVFLFYIVWQAGYAASMAASLPAKT
jgi:hypothetical protein